MDIWIMAFIGGLVGSFFMDFTETCMSKFGIYSGVKGSDIAKWLRGLVSGQFYHSNIEDMPALDHDLITAPLFHYIIGGGVVALGYAAIMTQLYQPVLAWHIAFSVVFGLMTCVLPWFILMPAIGKGVFGHKMPVDAKPVLAPVVSHIAYGLGIGMTLFFHEAITSKL